MAVLVGVLATAILMSVTIASLLLISTNRARLGFHQARRIQAWYAAEAGLWWAQEQIRNDPYVDATDPGFTDPVGDVDVTILNGSLGMTFNVDVVVSDQAGLAGVKRIVCNVNYTVS